MHAVETDVLGNRSEPSVSVISIFEDGQAAQPLSFTALPAGPLFLGGSTLSLTTADPQGRTASVQVSVAGSVVSQAQGPLGETRHSLPLQPEGAAVRADASVVTTDQGTLT